MDRDCSEMDQTRLNAYQVVLAQGLLHLKWDLACLIGGFSWLHPWNWRSALRSAHIAAHRACAFHNLAIFSTHDFKNFSEDQFWADLTQFHERFPEALCPYRDVFERYMRGESVDIVNPMGYEARQTAR